MWQTIYREEKLDNFHQHLQTHERRMDQTPQTGPSKTTKSPKQRRTVSPPPKTNQEKSRVASDTEVLPSDPETRALYIQHWQSIRTEEATDNRVQDRYNFTLHEMTASTFTEMVHRIFSQQTTAFKINVSFVFFHMTYGKR
jgi:hypothetical protein